MAVRSGQILHVTGDNYLVNRIQSAGVGNVNIPEEKVYELGNYNSVCVVRDIPDLSWDIESLAVTNEIEALLTGVAPGGLTPGQEFDFLDHKPLDVISPFKTVLNQYDVINGIALPYLTLERATYRFGLRQNATQQFTLRGDRIYWTKGSPYMQKFTNTGVGPYAFTNTAVAVTEEGNTIYAYGVVLKDSGSNAYKRLFYGTDYTDTTTNFTLTDDLSVTYDEVHVVYASAVTSSYPQSLHLTPTHPTAPQPCAIRGKNIDVYVTNTHLATPVLERWESVQSAEVTWSVSIENDEEFGNSHFVASDFETPDVTGSITLKPATVDELFLKIQQVTNTPVGETVNPLNSTPVEVEIRLTDPDTSAVVKTLYVPDARFTVPGYSPSSQQKLETQLSFTSDSGAFFTYEETR